MGAVPTVTCEPRRRRNNPYRVAFGDDRLFAMAGLYERWEPPEPETTQTGLGAFGGGAGEDDDSDDGGGPIETFTIVTTEPNDLVADLHHRMAVILEPDEATWLRGAPDRGRRATGPVSGRRANRAPGVDAGELSRRRRAGADRTGRLKHPLSDTVGVSDTKVEFSTSSPRRSDQLANAISKYSIMMTPAMSPSVAVRSYPLLWVSGMISSEMTNNIAPAANPIAYGNSGSIVATATAPAPLMGSRRLRPGYRRLQRTADGRGRRLPLPQTQPIPQEYFGDRSQPSTTARFRAVPDFPGCAEPDTNG